MKNLGKIIIFLLVLLILSLILLLFKEQVIFIDENLFYAINNFSNPFLDVFFITLTYFGSVIFWILLIFVLWLKKDIKLSIYLFYALIIDSLLSLSLKFVFIRPRPPENFLKNSIFIENISPSFPSGHAERAFSGAVILSSFYKFKIFYVLAILTGISRIYLGIHYPIDVLFGSLVGIIIGNLILNLPIKKLEKKLFKRL
jgi:undecaprenyl-diphosphatase